MKIRPVMYRLLTCGFAVAALRGAAGPAAAAAKTVCEFGTIRDSQTVARDLVVRNIGDAPLTVRNIRSTCGACVQVEPASLTVAPGKEGKIRAVLSGAALRGAVRKVIYASTDDPATPTLQFILEGDVKPYWTLTPRNGLIPGTIRSGQPGKWTCTLSFTDLPAFSVTAIDAPAGFTVRTALNTPATVFALTVSGPAAGAPPGIPRSPVVLHTDSPAEPRIEIPLHVRVISSVTPEPPFIVLRSGLNGGDSRPLFLRQTDGRKFRVTSIRSSGAVRVSAPRPTAASLVPLTVSIGPAADPAGGEIVIRTDDPGTPELRVPVFFSRSRKKALTPLPCAPPISPEAAWAAAAAATGTTVERATAPSASDAAAERAAWIAFRLIGKVALPSGERPAGRQLAVLLAARARVARLRVTDPAAATACEALLQSARENAR